MRAKSVLSLKLIFLLMLSLQGCIFSKSKASNNSKAYYALLSTKNVLHKLYGSGDTNVPHPISFYNDLAGTPVYSYENSAGAATFLYNPDTNELQYAISFSGLSSYPIMMHFHLGDAKQEGPIIQTIFGEPYKDVPGLGSSTEPPLSGKKAPRSRAGFVSGVYTLKGNPDLSLTAEEEKEKLMNGEIYVNLHTYMNEAGEIRGQILPCS